MADMVCALTLQCTWAFSLTKPIANPHTTHKVFRAVDVENHLGAPELAKALLLMSLSGEKIVLKQQKNH